VNPSDDLLSKAGVDIETGLKMLGGKRERYESILRKFASRQAGTVENIRTALCAGDTATAEREAHSLKGSAAAVGAGQLADEAGKVETAIRSGAAVEEALASLCQSLGTVVNAIRETLAD
jgi:two-component system sensor histidine kinase/response regulator